MMRAAEANQVGKPLGLARLDWKVCPWRGSSERDTKDELAFRPLPEVAAFISAPGSTNVQEMVRRESMARLQPHLVSVSCASHRDEGADSSASVGGLLHSFHSKSMPLSVSHLKRRRTLHFPFTTV